VLIHNSVIIGEHTVIGEDGLHVTRWEDGKLKHNPHEHGVIIEKDVWIGSLVSIDRGRWRDTRIGEGTVIDNHSHISHNVIIGKDVIISAHVTLLGSVEIGDGAEIWSNAVINQGVKIGKGAVVGANTYVRHDVEPGMVVYIKQKDKTKKYSGKSRDEYFTEMQKTEGGGVYKYR